MTKAIPLTQGKITLVDDEDYEKLKNIKICIKTYHGYYYAEATFSKDNHPLLHRVILNAKKGQVCDHINGDCLDNRRCNLRIVTHSQNMMNSKKTPNKKTSKFKGVWKRDNKWVSRIRLNYHIYHLGYFYNELDAAHAYDEAAKKYHGEYARLNFPEVTKNE